MNKWYKIFVKFHLLTVFVMSILLKSECLLTVSVMSLKDIREVSGRKAIALECIGAMPGVSTLCLQQHPD